MNNGLAGRLSFRAQNHRRRKSGTKQLTGSSWRLSGCIPPQSSYETAPPGTRTAHSRRPRLSLPCTGTASCANWHYTQWFSELTIRFLSSVNGTDFQPLSANSLRKVHIVPWKVKRRGLQRQGRRHCFWEMMPLQDENYPRLGGCFTPHLTTPKCQWAPGSVSCTKISPTGNAEEIPQDNTTLWPEPGGEERTSGLRNPHSGQCFL